MYECVVIYIIRIIYGHWGIRVIGIEKGERREGTRERAEKGVH